MIRLFIALPLSRQVQEQLGRLILPLKEKGGQVKWVEPKNIHLTVRFLGDTEQELVPAIAEQIDAVTSRFQPVETMIDRLGGFPNLNRPRVIWVGISEKTETLSEMAAQMEQGMRQLGFEPEKKRFRSHLTLGRVRRPQGLDQLISFIKDYKFEPILVELNRLCLFKSTLTPAGPIYEELHEKRLGG